MNKKKLWIGLGLLLLWLFSWMAYQRIFHGEEIDKANAANARTAAIAAKEDSTTKALLKEANERAANSTQSSGAALSEILKEPKVLDAVITEANVLYASVKDDGTRRDGYADYLCQVLKNNGLSNTTVKIVKHNSQKSKDRDNAYGVLLGQSSCSF